MPKIDLLWAFLRPLALSVGVLFFSCYGGFPADFSFSYPSLGNTRLLYHNGIAVGKVKSRFGVCFAALAFYLWELALLGD